MSRYRAKLGSTELRTGSFQEAQEAVANELTAQLQADPAGLAQSAQEANQAFNSGHVRETCDRTGMWAMQLPDGDLLRVVRVR